MGVMGKMPYYTFFLVLAAFFLIHLLFFPHERSAVISVYCPNHIYTRFSSTVAGSKYNW